eukprot:8925740-Pyramimonas_sp.AAC.1
MSREGEEGGMRAKEKGYIYAVSREKHRGHLPTAVRNKHLSNTAGRRVPRFSRHNSCADVRVHGS